MFEKKMKTISHGSEAKHDSSIKYSWMRYGFKERVAKKKNFKNEEKN